MTGVLWIPSSVLHPVRKTPLRGNFKKKKQATHTEA
jgi:hypothetical protein